MFSVVIDPAVHAALVVIFTALVNVLFAAIGIDLGNEIATGLATVIVGYILSLLGFGLWLAATARTRGLKAGGTIQYKPPFT